MGLRANRALAARRGPEEMAERWAAFHRESAESIHEMAIELRGLILKGCQSLGTRADVLPPQYVEVLSKLQDRVPPEDFRVVRRSVEHELGCELKDVFRWFSPEPVASASLAQVHEAELIDGRRVAVKVQYPGIDRLVKGDLSNLKTLFRSARWLEPDFDLVPLVDELAEHVPRELNFLSEGRNAETIAEFFTDRDDVGIPRVHWEHTTRRVLTMEFIDGIKITDTDRLAAAGIDPRAIAHTLVDVYCEQILRHGFFHADPHPGNLLVEPLGDGRARLVLVDFGLAKELPLHFRKGVVSFAGAMLQRDANAMANALLELGFETRDGRPDALAELAAAVMELVARFRDTANDGRFQELADELPERIRENPIVRVPTHLVLLGRVLGMLSGVNRSLGTRLDLAERILPYVV